MIADIEEKPPTSSVLNPKDIAARLKISYRSAVNLLEKGTIPGGFKAGGLWRIDEATFEAWYQEQITRQGPGGGRQTRADK